MIEQLKRENATNIYDGIKLGIELIEKRTDKSRNPSILFFTDGHPNQRPKEGEIKALDTLKEKYNIKYPVHTMGFGQYNAINSELIFDIAKLFNGMNGYIPDPTCIGTVFVNTISNILTTQALDTRLQLKFNSKNGAQSLTENLKYDIGDYRTQMVGNTLYINLGNLRYGQNCDFLLTPLQFDQNLEDYTIDAQIEF